ncbi:carbohydrate esterase family 12 protein [Amniculicola lignicola CBS 123094]|uniref:Carbohydrate esterase family 12 protein n=1 Tax=Amniculicola lignicola CBS 123094 TaxID=1392246 RepID=A0A6A5WKV0_9PLEO|nr:carbohydrate esterase family 12 protein [Amniculicola lignicola CBS 123094]
MRVTTLGLASSLAVLSQASSGHKHNDCGPTNNTVWLCGDSTTAPGGGHNGTEGWGQYLKYSFPPNIRVNNSAYAGRSARSFTREGRFQAIADKIVPGDWVVIEFGINDANGYFTPANDTKYRVDCPGMSEEPCMGIFNNATEIVQTYSTYLKQASMLFLARGASVILASPLLTNPYQSGTYKYNPSIYTYYAWSAAAALGGPAAGVYFVDHGAYAAQATKLLGQDQVNAWYPMDNTHLAPGLADVYAKAFTLGVKCGGSGLGYQVVNTTSRIEGPVLGACLGVNATMPI